MVDNEILVWLTQARPNHGKFSDFIREFLWLVDNTKISLACQARPD